MINTKTKAEILNGSGVIAWFDDFAGENPRRFLSNFYVGDPIRLPLTWGDVWTTSALAEASIDPDAWIEGPTGEHVFAAFKAASLDEFVDVLYAHDPQTLAPDPGMSKARGRKVRLRADWEEAKYDVMAMVLRCKFTLDRPEGQMLLDTGEALLVEGTYWGDQVWGVALRKPADPLTAPGRNWLGTLLMARRAELRAEKLFGVTPATVKWNAKFSM